MNRTRADLLRDAKSGSIKFEMVYCYGRELVEKIQGIRTVEKVNTVSIGLRGKQGVSYLDIPNASLMEYTDDSLTIYDAGYRDLNDTEKAVMARWNDIAASPESQMQYQSDAYTDGTTMFYKEKWFFEKEGYNYLRGFDTENGCKYDWNVKKIRDNKIKGEKTLEYVIHREG